MSVCACYVVVDDDDDASSFNYQRKKSLFFPSLVAFSKFSENGLLLKLIVIASFKCV